jgi:uncharacterized protein (DUF302 family)
MKEHKGFYIIIHLEAEPLRVLDIFLSILNKKGLKIIKKIDITKEIKKDIGIDWIFYTQLDVINPEIMYKTLSIDKTVGILTPIRVLIYEDDTGTSIIAQDPRFSARLVDNPTIIEISQNMAEILINILKEVEEQLKK